MASDFWLRGLELGSVVLTVIVGDSEYGFARYGIGSDALVTAPVLPHRSVRADLGFLI